MKPARRWALRVGGLCTLSLLAVTLSLQGWRARTELYPWLTDLVTQITAADELLHEGRLPDQGSVAGTFGRLPPGTVWLLVPGLLVFKDPRLFGVPTSALLFPLTLVGIVLLGRAWWSETVGWIAAALYSFSWIGLFFSSSLWQRGHPFFVVWIIYGCYLAVRRARRHWLLLAVTCYVIGVYVHPELIPVGAVIVVALALNRALLTWWLIPATALVTALVWAPYLRYQYEVKFADSVRLIAGDTHAPGEPEWCGDSREVRDPVSGAAVNFRDLDYRYPPRPRDLAWRSRLLTHDGPAFARSFLANTSSQSISGTLRSAVFGVLLLVGLVVAWAGAARVTTAGRRSAGRWFTPPEERSRSPEFRMLTILLLSGFVCGQLVWSLASPDQTRRFMWLWPLQCLFIAAAVSAGSRWLPRAVAHPALPASALVASLAIPAIVPRVSDWQRHGWSNRDAPLISLLDHVAQHRKVTGDADRDSHVSLSYDVPLEPFNVAINSVDRRYRLGMGADLYLRYKHGLQQDVLCADSHRNGSRYRIREDAPTIRRDERGRLAFFPRHGADAGYVLLRHEGELALLWRP